MLHCGTIEWRNIFNVKIFWSMVYTQYYNRVYSKQHHIIILHSNDTTCHVLLLCNIWSFSIYSVIIQWLIQWNFRWETWLLESHHNKNNKICSILFWTKSSTIRTYQAATKQFSDFCSEFHISTPYPLTQHLLCQYVSYLGSQGPSSHNQSLSVNPQALSNLDWHAITRPRLHAEIATEQV